MIYHVLLMKIDPTRDAEAAALLDEIGALKDKVPGVVDYHAGPECSEAPAARAQGYNYGFVMTLSSKAALEHYQNHPEHLEVKDKVLATAEELLAFDFED